MSEPADRPPTELERLVRWLDERTGVAEIARTGLRKVFPDHWSFLLGELALFCLVVLVATGTFLIFFYVPDSSPVTYEGAYAVLNGSTVSAAFASVLHLSFDVPAGLLMRQIHHWAALVFVACIVAHASRIFFTGAFRRPRELNWLVGIGLLVLALAEGFSGYSLPDDLLSGTGLRILDSVFLSVPLVGPSLAALVFGGEFPTQAIISRLFVFHVFLVPALLIGGVALHLTILVVQKHTQYRGGRAREDNVVGRAFWPGQAFRSAGLFFLTAAVIAGIGGLVQINPVWLYGTYVPYAVSSPAQPDWYMGWLEGAIRIGPPFEPTILGVTISTLFLPAVVLPGLLFSIFVAWPWIERRLTGDTATHHLLDLPWEQPVRLASGAALLTAFIVLTFAGANDVLAATFSLGLEQVTDLFRVLFLLAPPVAWLVAWRVAHELRERRSHGSEPGQPWRRNEAGGYDVADP